MQWHLLGLINRGMNEEARQVLETNIRSSDKSEWTIEAKLAWVTGGTTRRAWRHTFTKSDRRQEGLSADVNECWPRMIWRTLRMLPDLSSTWVSTHLISIRGSLNWSWRLSMKDGVIWFNTQRQTMGKSNLRHTFDTQAIVLRGNVCKNRAKSKFHGHSQKIIFAYILSIDRHK